MRNGLYEKLDASPVIAAVKRPEEMDAALRSPCSVLFLLCGNIFNLDDLVARTHEAKKLIFLHIDLIEGFSRDAVALRYICQHIGPDGIISTKSSQIKMAKELGLLTVQRLFILDSLSMQTAVKTVAALGPDAVEIMPGIMPKIIARLQKELAVPLIAGGLINEKEDVIGALNAGALGVSTTNPAVWNL